MNHLHRSGKPGRQAFRRKTESELAAEAQRRSITKCSRDLANSLKKSITGFQFEYKYQIDGQVYEFVCIPLRVIITIRSGWNFETLENKGFKEFVIGSGLIGSGAEGMVDKIFTRLGYQKGLTGYRKL